MLRCYADDFFHAAFERFLFFADAAASVATMLSLMIFARLRARYAFIDVTIMPLADIYATLPLIMPLFYATFDADYCHATMFSPPHFAITCHDASPPFSFATAASHCRYACAAISPCCLYADIDYADYARHAATMLMRRRATPALI